MVITFAAGDEQVKLSPQIVRNYLVNGSAETVTDQEIVMFMNLCKFQHLNPFLREAYLIKYGSQPATIVTGKAALEKRAARCKNFEGFAAGVIVIDHNGDLKYRDGCLVLNGEELVGGWCDAHVTGFKVPVRAEVSLNEYIGRKKDGTVNAQWAGKPATMIRKVAKMQALREAFPEDFAGMYSAEELGVGDADMPEMPIQSPPQAQPEPPHIVDVEPITDNVPPDDFAALMEG
jgi:phage recombination protein Bet